MSTSPVLTLTERPDPGADNWQSAAPIKPPLMMPGVLADVRAAHANTARLVCSAEYDQLAAAWPRASFGYTDLSTKHMGVRAVLETRADIAKDLMTLRAPMPGMKLSQDSLFDFGFSANLTKLPDLATKYADATDKSPWKCPQLAQMNQGADQSKTTLTNPAFAGYAPMFHGLHAIVDKLVMTDGQSMPDIAAVVAIGSDNPASLLAMAGSFAPNIASLGLKPDGVAKQLPPMPNMQLNAPLFAAIVKSFSKLKKRCACHQYGHDADI